MILHICLMHALGPSTGPLPFFLLLQDFDKSHLLIKTFAVPYCFTCISQGERGHCDQNPRADAVEQGCRQEVWAWWWVCHWSKVLSIIVFFFIMTSCIHTMQTIFWMIFKNNIRGNFSQSLVQRWLDETWPLGVQCAMTQGRKGAFDLNFHARSICTFPPLNSFALTAER